VKASEAAHHVNGMIFRPGWKFRAEPFFGSSSLVFIEAEITTVDTSYPSPDGEYQVPKVITLDTVLRVDELDLPGLCERIILWAESCDLHEDREFLRVWDGGRWRAPLHPHTDEGQRAWEMVSR
jgi:hypothetical protein